MKCGSRRTCSKVSRAKKCTGSISFMTFFIAQFSGYWKKSKEKVFKNKLDKNSPQQAGGPQQKPPDTASGAVFALKLANPWSTNFTRMKHVQKKTIGLGFESQNPSQIFRQKPSAFDLYVCLKLWMHKSMDGIYSFNVLIYDIHWYFEPETNKCIMI